MNKKFLLIFLLVIVGLSIAARLLPHAPNFTPIAALALFCGVYAAKMHKGFLFLPLGAMLVSDLFIGFYEWRTMAVVYGSFFAIGLGGLLIQRYKNVGTVTLGALVSALLFYLTTNFAVWAFSGYYAPTVQGLMLSYTMALPFFKFTILGNLFYVALFFGIYEFATSLSYKFYGQPATTTQTNSN